MDTIFEIDTQKTKKTVKNQQKIEKIWHNKIAIVIDKINIVSLDFFATLNFYLDKTKALNLSVVLNKLLIIIFLSNFF